MYAIPHTSATDDAHTPTDLIRKRREIARQTKHAQASTSGARSMQVREFWSGPRDIEKITDSIVSGGAARKHVMAELGMNRADTRFVHTMAQRIRLALRLFRPAV